MGKPILAVLLCLALGESPLAGQDADPDLVAKEGPAAVIVRVTTSRDDPPHLYGGFLLAKAGSRGVVVSSRGATKHFGVTEVVFRGGTSSQKTCTAKSMGDSGDYSWFLLEDAPSLPAPPPPGDSTRIKEGLKGFICGFPFPKGDSYGQNYPVFKMEPVGVKGITRDPNGTVRRVELDRKVDRGYLGGFFVDDAGSLLGIVSEEPEPGPSSWFVPASGPLDELVSRIVLYELGQTGYDPAKVSIGCKVRLSDIFHQVKSVGITFVRSDALKQEPAPEPDGTWKGVLSKPRDVPLKFVPGHASGVVEFPRTAQDPKKVTWVFQAYCKRANGSTHWTEPLWYELRYKGCGEEPIGTKTGKAISEVVKVTAGEVDLPPEPPDSPPPAALQPLDTSDGLTLAGRLPLEAAIGGMQLSRDGRYLFVLDCSAGEILKINTDDLSVAVRVRAPPNSISMALSVDEKSLYVVGFDPPPARVGPKTGRGLLALFRSENLDFAGSTTLQDGPLDVLPLKDGRALVTLLREYEGVCLVDPKKETIVQSLSLPRRCFLRLYPDGTRAYAGTDDDFIRVTLGEKVSKASTGVPTSERGKSGRNFALSPDGRFLLASQGLVFRLSKTPETDLGRIAEIDPWVALAQADGSSTFLTASLDGTVRQYEFGEFAPKKSFKVDRLCTRLCLDPKRNRLYAFGVELPDPRLAEIRHDYWHDRLVAGDILVYAMSEKK